MCVCFCRYIGILSLLKDEDIAELSAMLNSFIYKGIPSSRMWA